MPEETPTSPENQKTTSTEPSYKPREDEKVLTNSSLAAVEAESGEIAGSKKTSDTDKSLADEAPVAVAAASNPLRTSTVAQAGTPKKSKKGRIIAASIALVFLLLGAGSVAAYMWYQNPEKVVLDGVINAAQAKTFIVDGKMNVSMDEGKVDITFDTKGGAEAGYNGSVNAKVRLKNGPELSLGGEGTYMANGDIYFRAKGLLKTYDIAVNAFLDEMASQATKKGTKVTDAQKKEARQTYDQMFKPVVMKLDNQWIKVSVADMKEVNKKAGQEYECIQTVFKKASTDKEFGKQLRELYQKHRLLTVTESGNNKGDSKGYIVEVNEDKAKDFEKDVENLPLYKELENCSDNKSSNDDRSSRDSSKDDKATNRIEVWVHQWNHTISGFNITSESAKNKATFDGTTKFNEPLTITAPAGAKSLKEFQKEMEQIMSSIGASTTNSSRTVGDTNET